MTEPYTPTKRANRVADWIETECLLRGKATGSDALNEVGKAHGYHASDVGLGLTTMSRRAAVLGDAYPFRIANGAAALPLAEEYPWVALLLMSSESPIRRTLNVGIAAAHLERV
ncbi:hypothetical protein, partial [Intrasporangium sp.]|uniref:hypothetical protein n=1 Tax=Intrasporangium sp. TaxID=1925024 RepID=UPI003221D1DC